MVEIGFGVNPKFGTSTYFGAGPVRARTGIDSASHGSNRRNIGILPQICGSGRGAPMRRERIPIVIGAQSGTEAAADTRTPRTLRIGMDLERASAATLRRGSPPIRSAPTLAGPVPRCPHASVEARAAPVLNPRPLRSLTYVEPRPVAIAIIHLAGGADTAGLGSEARSELDR